MTSAQKPPWHGCPVRYAASIFGDKWCFVILRDLLLHGKRTYGDLLDSEEQISTNILADRLSRLEETGMVKRLPDPVKRSRVYYFPTAKSRALLPAFLGMMVWATQFDEQSDAPSTFAEAFLNDPQGTAQWYEDEIDRIDRELLTPRE